ncbi:uncharacterized protein FFUJ_08370 [Fusarium fujikuroi IMI 58289]|uniref:Uncharacterized protein n=2 Tax=Fusarium fujikuroi TaxID=5127 RepID=S0EB76_GIBF5|nr:uncharacterized protein FFUJ_08370 [Fusarium fujikuroi IMI 58289]SCO11548.1 uncharacterized protein FFE2_12355 [Fusarium fujikuroi]CCT71910.1 uncharacterized protein FFUJ_08370 [Fusarium fujikuroi IMI 58289]SCO20109.1 uncharacterized protein FFM5_12247 [Fusarium fujikuroi]SCO50466.1 uncharacterized protein FFNC_13042 [Fusarium fujikuroi]SCO51605.1 uncharacterized protein FFMR_10621 [Fusarium fujikuroi]
MIYNRGVGCAQKGDRGPEPEPELEPGGAAENGLRIAPDRGVGGCRSEVTGEEEDVNVKRGRRAGGGRGEGKRAVGNSSQRDLEGENQGGTEAAKWTGGADTTPVTGNSWGGWGGRSGSVGRKGRETLKASEGSGYGG